MTQMASAPGASAIHAHVPTHAAAVAPGLHADAGGGAFEGDVFRDHVPHAARGVAADGKPVAEAQRAIADGHVLHFRHTHLLRRAAQQHDVVVASADVASLDQYVAGS